MSDLIISCVSAGVYLISSGDKVIGDLQRVYNHNQMFEEYYYLLTWRGMTSRETFRTLPDVYKSYKFSNYPGYNAILRTSKEKASAGPPKEKKVYHDLTTTGERQPRV